VRVVVASASLSSALPLSSRVKRIEELAEVLRAIAPIFRSRSTADRASTVRDKNQFAAARTKRCGTLLKVSLENLTHNAVDKGRRV